MAHCVRTSPSLRSERLSLRWLEHPWRLTDNVCAHTISLFHSWRNPTHNTSISGFRRSNIDYQFWPRQNALETRQTLRIGAGYIENRFERGPSRLLWCCVISRVDNTRAIHSSEHDMWRGYWRSTKRVLFVLNSSTHTICLVSGTCGWTHQGCSIIAETIPTVPTCSKNMRGLPWVRPIVSIRV